MSVTKESAAIHTEQSFIDKQAISWLEYVVSSSKKAMPDLKANDKWPNIDGFIEMTNEFGVPLSNNFAVQVKGTESSFNNEYIFYSKEIEKTKEYRNPFLNYCRENYEDQLILLIVVYLEDKKACWKLIDEKAYIEMDKSFISKQEKLCKVVFDPKNIIEEGNFNFIHKWEEIRRNFKNSLFRILTPEEGENINIFLEEFNYVVNNYFPIIKKNFFPKNTGRIGLAYWSFEHYQIFFTLYPIEKNSNEGVFKKLITERQIKFYKETYGYQEQFGTNEIVANPKASAWKKIRFYMEEYILKHNLLDFGCDEYLISEFVFELLRQYRNEIKVDSKYSQKELQDMFVSPMFSTDPAIPVTYINEQQKPLDSEIINDYLKNISEEGIKKVHLDDINHEYSFSLGNKTKKDMEIYFKGLMSNFERCYNNFLDANFPNLKEELGFFQGDEKSVIITLFEIIRPNEYKQIQYKVYYLKEELSNKFTVLIGDEAIEFEENCVIYNSHEDIIQGKVDVKILYKNKEYTISPIPLGGGDFYSLPNKYRNMPMHNMIFNLLEERLKKYLENKKAPRLGITITDIPN